MSKEQAYAELKEISGQDFGMDLEKWEKWVNKNYASVRRAAISSPDPEEL
jgi:hypothetical protein